MTFSGIAAVQARIQEIEQQSGLAKPAAAAATTSAPSATAGTDFASVLSSALNTQSAASAGALGGASSASGTSTSPDISSLLSSLSGSGSTTSPDITSLISSLTGSAGSTTGVTAASSRGLNATAELNATGRQFVETALAQAGKPYQWGATASTTDANPASFDCSELTKWAAARSNVTIPDGAAHQYAWLKEQGATMPVQQALQTPGALLFHFTEEPQPGLGGEPEHAHVAISLGNDKTIEAKGHAYGVGVFDAGDRFNYAGMISGMT